MPPHDDDDGAHHVPPPPRPSRSRGHQPSFSAALLDAIYHSLEADAEPRSSTEARRARTPASASASSSPARRTAVSSRRRPTPEQSPSRSSVRSPRLQRTPRPCRVRPDPQPNSNSSVVLLPPPLPPPHPHELPSTGGDRRAADAEKTRGRRKSKSKRTTAKAAAPFACLLNALLCNRRPARARSVDGHTPRATATAAAAPETPASARSILSSRATRRESAATGGILTPARRAVRFSPVATVVGDEHGHGAVGTAPTTGLPEMARAKESAAETERRVEELLRALGVADEPDRAKESSESSSDLFELEGLPAFEDRDNERPRSRIAAAGDGAGMLARPRPRVAL